MSSEKLRSILGILFLSASFFHNISYANPNNSKSQSFVVGITIVESCNINTKNVISYKTLNNIIINCSHVIPFNIQNNYIKNNIIINKEHNNIEELNITTIYF